MPQRGAIYNRRMMNAQPAWDMKRYEKYLRRGRERPTLRPTYLSEPTSNTLGACKVPRGIAPLMIDIIWEFSTPIKRRVGSVRRTGVVWYAFPTLGIENIRERVGVSISNIYRCTEGDLALYPLYSQLGKYFVVR